MVIVSTRVVDGAAAQIVVKAVFAGGGDADIEDFVPERFLIRFGLVVLQKAEGGIGGIPSRQTQGVYVVLIEAGKDVRGDFFPSDPTFGPSDHFGVQPKGVQVGKIYFGAVVEGAGGIPIAGNFGVEFFFTDSIGKVLTIRIVIAGMKPRNSSATVTEIPTRDLVVRVAESAPSPIDTAFASSAAGIEENHQIPLLGAVGNFQGIAVKPGPLAVHSTNGFTTILPAQLSDAIPVALALVILTAFGTIAIQTSLDGYFGAINGRRFGNGDSEIVGTGEIPEIGVDGQKELVPFGIDVTLVADGKPTDSIKRADDRAIVKSIPVPLVSVGKKKVLGTQSAQALSLYVL